MRHLSALLFSIMFCGIAFAEPTFDYTNPPLNIKTVDGATSTYPYSLKVSNGTLTDNGDGTVTLTTGGGGGSGGDLTGRVPYTGATSSVVLGNYDISARYATAQILYATSSVIVGADTDTISILGRAKIGDAFSSISVPDYASFGHFDNFTPSSYALSQGPSGDTFLNSAAGQSLTFRINNGNVGFFSSGGNFQVGGLSNNPTFNLLGNINGSDKYFAIKVDDTDDYINFLRQDSSILGLKINMPVTLGTYSISASEAVLTTATASVICASTAVGNYYLPFSKGATGQTIVLQTDGTSLWQTPATGGGSGTPGGSNRAVQFNDNSSFGGATNLSWDKASNNLTATGSITLSNFTPVSTPAVNTLSFYGSTTQGHTRPTYIDDDGIVITMSRDNFIIAKNTTASIITKGQVVYVSGQTGNVPNVGLAKADSSSTLPAVGIAMSNVAVNGFGYFMKLGVLSNFNTSSFLVGDQVYVSTTTAGALQSSRPTNPNYVQRIGSCLVSGTGNGSLLVTIAPFVGNRETGTNQSVYNFTNIASAPVMQVGTLNATGPVTITGSTDAVQLKVTANATQTNPISQILGSDGITNKWKIDSSGNITQSGYIIFPNVGTTAGALYSGSTTDGANTGFFLHANGSNTNFFGGLRAGQKVTSGTGNTGVGNLAGYGITGANYVTAVGYSTGLSFTAGNGSFNSLFGAIAGTALTTGASNIFLGYSAGRYQTTAANTLIIDNQDNTNASNELAHAILYGQMNSIATNQLLTTNGSFKATNTATANVLSINANGSPYYLPFSKGATGQVPTLQTDGTMLFQTPTATVGSGYSTVEDEGTPLIQRTTMNFTGAGVTASDSGGKTVVNIPGGGSSGSTAPIVWCTTLLPESSVLDANSPPAITVLQSSGSGTPRFRVADFDSATEEKLYWTFTIPNDVNLSQSASSCVLNINWFATGYAGATSSVVWIGRFSVASPTNGVSLLTQNAGATSSIISTGTATPNNFATNCILTIEDSNGFASNSVVTLCFGRNAGNASDTFAGDARLHSIKLTIPRT